MRKLGRTRGRAEGGHSGEIPDVLQNCFTNPGSALIISLLMLARRHVHVAVVEILIR